METTVQSPGANGRALLHVENIKKTYKTGTIEVHALRGVSLDVHRGEFLAIMGASGGGKSTFMNILGCLDTPSSGHFWLEGQPVGDMTKVERARIRNLKIGFVFQGFNLLPRTTALENVELPLMYQQVSKQERHDRAMEALRLVGLEKRHDHKPNELSGGQQQRVAIARALITHPSIILADEPTGNLDTKTSIEIMELFLNLNSQNQITILVVTHESDIAQYTTRNVVFRDGRIIRDFPVEDRLDPKEQMKKLLEASILED